MKVVIIPADGFVSINGRGFSKLAFSTPPNVHAVAWKDTVGEAQVTDETGAIVANAVLESLNDYQGALDAWEAMRVTTDTPAPQATLAARRARLWEDVKIAREHRRQAGVFVAGHWFHSNDTSRIQQIGLVLMGAGIPAGLLWRTMDNGEVPMTQTLAGQIFQAVATSDALHFQAAKDLRALIEASSDPESVNLEQGWPASYTPQ